MDPNACLTRFLDALRAGDRDEAAGALDDLRDWLAGGGFLPSDPRPASEPEPTGDQAIADAIAEYVAFQARGVGPGEPFSTEMEDLVEAVAEATDLGQVEPSAVLAAVPRAESLLRQKHPEASAAWEDRRPSLVTIVWTGL